MANREQRSPMLTRVLQELQLGRCPAHKVVALGVQETGKPPRFVQTALGEVHQPRKGFRSRDSLKCGVPTPSTTSRRGSSVQLRLEPMSRNSRTRAAEGNRRSTRSAAPDSGICSGDEAESIIRGSRLLPCIEQVQVTEILFENRNEFLNAVARNAELTSESILEVLVFRYAFAAVKLLDRAKSGTFLKPRGAPPDAVKRSSEPRRLGRFDQGAPLRSPPSQM